MERFKLVALFIERFKPDESLDVSALPDKEIVVMLLTQDLKVRNLSYVQIMNKYGLTMSIARRLKNRIVNTRTVKDKQ